MSIKIMSAVWGADEAIKDLDKLAVMLALADWSNDQGVSWPSMPSLAKKSRMKVRKAQYVVQGLVEIGMLSVALGTGRGKTNQFKINLHSLQSVDDKGCTDEQERVHSMHPLSDKGCTDEQERVHGYIDRARAEPSKPEPSRSKPKASAPDFELPEWLDRDLWAGFEEVRVNLKKPMTFLARKLIVEKLGKFRARGMDPNLSLRESIEGSWQGVFEPKGGCDAGLQKRGSGRPTESNRDRINRQAKEDERRISAGVSGFHPGFADQRDTGDAIRDRSGGVQGEVIDVPAVEVGADH